MEEALKAIFYNIIAGLVLNWEVGRRVNSREISEAHAERLRNRNEALMGYEELIRPSFEELFNSFEIARELNDFLIAPEVINQIRGTLNEQAHNQSWSRVDLINALTLPEGFGLLPELEAFIDRLIDALDAGNHFEAERRANEMIEDIDHDHEHVGPQLKAAVLTCRAQARLSLDRIAESNGDFHLAFTLHFDPVTGVNWATALMREDRWSEAQEIADRLREAFPADFRCRVIAADIAFHTSADADIESILGDVQPESVDDFILLAELRLQQGNYDEAASAAEAALALSSGNPFAKFFLAHGLAFDLISGEASGYLTAERDRMEQAIQLLTEARTTFDEACQPFWKETIYINLSCLYLRLGQPDLALAELEAARDDLPESQALLERLWKLLTICNRTEEAITLARSLFQHNPTEESALRESTTLVLTGQLSEAAAAVEVAMERIPSLAQNPEFVVMRAHLLIWADPPRLREAIDLLTAGLDQSPNDVTLRVVRAEVHAKLGETEQVRSGLEQAPSLESSSTVISSAGRILLSVEQWESANELLKIQNIDSEEDPLLLDAAQAALFSGDYSEAERLLSVPSDSHPAWLKCQANLADLMVRTGRFDEARTKLTELEDQGEHAELARINLAGVLRDRADFVAALEILEPCIESPDYTDTRIMAATLLAASGRPREAVEQARIAVEHEGDSHEALVTYAYCFREKIRARMIVSADEDALYQSVIRRLAR